MSLIAGFTGPIAYAAKTFEVYALPVSTRPTWIKQDLLACLVILMCLSWHAILPRIGEFGQNFVVGLKLTALFTFLVVAAAAGDGKWMGASTAVVETRSTWQVMLVFAGALVWISLSYSGFNAAVYVAGEVRDTGTVARSLVTATVITVTLYVLLNAVFVYGPPSSLILDDEGLRSPGSCGNRGTLWIGGNRLAIFIRITIAIALFTSVSSMMLSAPRVYAKMADDGVMPRWMAFADGYPRAAMAAQAFLAIVMVLSSRLAELLNYLSLTLALSAAGTVACLFAPSIRRTRSGPLFAPLFFVVATLLSAVLLAIDNPKS